MSEAYGPLSKVGRGVSKKILTNFSKTSNFLRALSAHGHFITYYLKPDQMSDGRPAVLYPLPLVNFLPPRNSKN